jgi:hypothetical protein
MNTWFTRSVLVLPLLLQPAITLAQPKPPRLPASGAATSSAKAPPMERPDAGAATDAGAAALPAGHPPVEDPLPAGHPPVAPDQAHPSSAPPGHGQQQRSTPEGMFEPPEDVAKDDPALPPGTIVATIADAEGKPIANAPLVLGILRNTVAKGESRERMARDTTERARSASTASSSVRASRTA